MFLQFGINIILTYLIVFGMSIFMGKEAPQVVAALSVAGKSEIPYLAGVVVIFYFTSGMVRKGDLKSKWTGCAMAVICCQQVRLYFSKQYKQLGMKKVI